MRVTGSDGVERTIYRNEQYVIARTTFINGGRQIGVMMYGGFDAENPAFSQQYRYEIINRDGSIGATSTPVNAFNRVFGTHDGFILLNLDERGSGGNYAYLMTYVDSEATILWESNPGVNGYITLEWIPPMTVDDPLQSFLPLQ